MAKRFIKAPKDAIIWTREDQGRMIVALNMCLVSRLDPHPVLLRHHAVLKSTIDFTDEESPYPIVAKHAFDLASKHHALCAKAQEFIRQQAFYGYIGAWEAGCGHFTSTQWLKRALLPNRQRVVRGEIVQPRHSLDALKPKRTTMRDITQMRDHQHKIQTILTMNVPYKPKQ